MAPKAKTPAKAKAKAKPEAKAKASPGSPAAGSGANAVKQARTDATNEKDPKIEEAENLLRECLEAKDIAEVDGRVLDIAVSQARLQEGVDKELLSRGEKRLEEFQAFELELKKRADELRKQKDEVIEKHNQENDEFTEACKTRQDLKKGLEELFDAIGDSELDKVREYVRSLNAPFEGGFAPPPLPIDAEDHEGNTPLSEAACYGEMEIVEFLLQNGAHPNARNHKGRTPVWRATYNGHEDVVKFLLEKGGDPSIETNDGEPAGKHGTPGTKALVADWDRSRTDEKQANITALQRLEYPWPRQLLEATVAGDRELVGSVLSAIATAEGAESDRAKVILRTVLDYEDMVDVLWMACAKGHDELCRMLLDASADVNSSTQSGITCLMICCRRGHTAIAKELMARGAKTYIRSEEGRLASDYAREYGDGHYMHDIVVQHCKKVEDWTTLEEEARQHAGNKTCGAEGVEDIVEGRKNAGASDKATAALKQLSADELREGSDRYKELLEQRALADVLGVG